MNDQSTSSRPAPPPLRIHHLMACAAVAAVQLTYWRSRLSDDALGRISAIETTGLMLLAIGQVVAASGLTLAIFSLYWHVKGRAGVVQPGQWLLFGYIVSVLHLVFVALFSPTFSSRIPWSRINDPTDVALAVVYFVLVLIYYGLPVLLFGWGAWRVADTWPWRILFTILAIGSVLSIVPLFSIFTNRFGWAVNVAIAATFVSRSGTTLLVAVWVTINDCIRRQKRVWTHWAGLGLFIVERLLNVVNGLFFWLGWY